MEYNVIILCMYKIRSDQTRAISMAISLNIYQSFPLESLNPSLLVLYTIYNKLL